jgi:quercetin dioxygenase-like cupin family protein
VTIQDRTVRPAERETETFDWGEIVWLDSHPLTGSTGLTVGEVTIAAGRANGAHYHPDCEEALYLLEGELRHTLGEEETRLEAGDCLHIPAEVVHAAESVGDRDAVAVIAYDTGDREAVFVADE